MNMSEKELQQYVTKEDLSSHDKKNEDNFKEINLKIDPLVNLTPVLQQIVDEKKAFETMRNNAVKNFTLWSVIIGAISGTVYFIVYVIKLGK